METVKTLIRFHLEEKNERIDWSDKNYVAIKTDIYISYVRIQYNQKSDMS